MFPSVQVQVTGLLDTLSLAPVYPSPAIHWHLYGQEEQQLFVSVLHRICLVKHNTEKGNNWRSVRTLEMSKKSSTTMKNSKYTEPRKREN